MGRCKMLKENEFEILYAIKKMGMAPFRDLAFTAGVSLGTVSTIMGVLKKSGLVNKNGITKNGLLALKPYKVDNAIIMAAGLSPEFVPLSLEKPKGLLVVKGEVLIERQISQLRNSGIRDIIVILGYKKEAFFYLEEKFGVKIIINSEFNRKGNVETLFLARQFLKNTYICSSDDYFAKNVFEPFVYTTYYASVHVDEKSNEWYAICGPHKRIKKIKKFGCKGDIMLGHAYWNREFSRSFAHMLAEHHGIGDYDQSLWEQLFSDNIKKLPPMQAKTYPKDLIFEFDSLEELRRFDEKYVNNVESKIMSNICQVLSCEEKDIVGFKAIKEGITNTSFVFEVKGTKYVYRHPGEDTGKFINRLHEKKALELAKSIGMDPTFLYMNETEGWKISYFVSDFHVPDYRNADDTKKVLNLLRKLHGKCLSVNWDFSPWEEALVLEGLVEKNGAIQMNDFMNLKNKTEEIYKKTIGDGVEKRFCHCDTYASNWMISGGKVILIDWEYAGNGDPGCDLGGYIMDGMYSIDEARAFIKEYCGSSFNSALEFHYLAYVSIVSFYWFVWALYRESCGIVMGDSLHNWYIMAKRFSSYLSK
jgi:CTP:phosphocholine cytidylyltransferase-like protein/thiamine kinase-like enzyme